MGYGITHLMSTTTPKKSKRGGKGCGKAGPQTVLSGSNMGVFKVDGPPTKRRAGRPCEYSVERTDYICAELAKGRSLHSILQEPGSTRLHDHRGLVGQIPRILRKIRALQGGWIRRFRRENAG
jgi:hypothetical protein